MMDLQLGFTGKGSTTPSAYLQGRPHRFTIQGPGVATYEDPDTGVVAQLRFDAGGLRVSIPVARPSYWGVEVGEQLARLAKACGLALDGHQVRAEAIRAAWDTANRAAWSLDPATERIHLPDAAVRAWGSWNSELSELRPLYPKAHVPKVQLVRFQDRWQTAVIWTDLCDVVLPPVEVGLVLCAALAARGLPPGLVAVERSAIEARVGPIPASGVQVARAARDDAWLATVRGGVPVVGRLQTIHPEDGIEEGLVSGGP